MMNRNLFAAIAVLASCLFAGTAPAQQSLAPTSTATPSDHVLVTVVFRHDQSLNLNQINKIQEEQRFFGRIPPAGVDVVSWHVAMGLGYVVVFKVPPARLRDLNRSVEQGAWGAFKTEFYPTYDLTAPIRALHETERNRP